MTTQISTKPRRLHHLIPGTPAPSSETPTYQRINPFTGIVASEVSLGTKADAALAIAAARQEFDEGTWATTAGSERAKVLLKWAQLTREAFDELVQIESAEVGKSINAARGDVEVCIDHIEFAAHAAATLHGESFDDIGGRLLSYTRREPVGVVGAITAWNYPALLFCNKVPFALAAGNTVVVKPALFTSGSTVLLSQLAHRAGLPEGALVVLLGKGPEVGQPLAESLDVDVLTFTGSTFVANTLSSVKRIFPQRQYFELGGKGATVVFADADLDQAVDGALFGFTVNQGETCTAGTRLLVEDSIADEFVERLGQALKTVRVGDPLDESTQLGPMINAEQYGKVLDYISGAEEGGASIISGVISDESATGQMIAPTVVDGVHEASAIFQEEVFGPVLVVTRFSGEDEAIRLSNATMYGLSNSIWTNDVTRAIRISRGMKVGTVWINTTMDQPAHLPFGGVKASGFGREKGALGVEEFTQMKTVSIQTEERKKIYGL
jgi:acyl-CoA reductase-like NAD-dependent aldehyde dehydrogenase